jgi:carboxypeptidase family protein
MTSLLLAVLLLAAGGGARADEPKPAPSPAPQEQATPAPGAAAEPADKTSDGVASNESDGKPVRAVFGTIMGTIFDTKKRPLGGWMVQCSSQGDGSVLRVTGTDDRGQYVFKDLPAGTYDLEIQSESEGSRKKGRIEVKPPFRNIVDFEVGPQAPEKPNPLAAHAAAAARTRADGDATDGFDRARAIAGTLGLDGAAAKPVPVRGTFLDAQKRPVSEVSVTLVALDGKETLHAFSGDDGTFSVPAVPPGPYRVLVFSPGHVPIDLKSIRVLPMSGLNLSLSLVDYPLNTKGRPEERLPREEPMPLPSPAPTSQPS